VAATYFAQFFASGTLRINGFDCFGSRCEHGFVIGSSHRLQLAEATTDAVRGPAPGNQLAFFHEPVEHWRGVLLDDLVRTIFAREIADMVG
jgi:hypothetical protein